MHVNPKSELRILKPYTRIHERLGQESLLMGLKAEDVRMVLAQNTVLKGPKA